MAYTNKNGKGQSTGKYTSKNQQKSGMQNGTKKNTTSQKVAPIGAKNYGSTAAKPWSPQPVKNTPVTPKKGPYTKSLEDKRSKATAGKPKSFMDKLQATQTGVYNIGNFALTENGAVSYATSGSALVDINFAIASLRGKSDKEISTKFRNAFNENPELAMRWLFMARDAREGVGERNLFKVCMMDLTNNGMSELVKALIPLIPEYGRWDDMWCLLDLKATKTPVLNVVKSQLKRDIENYHAGKSVSLLGKWLPSQNASSAKTKKYGEMIQKSLKWTPKQYRQTLSALREHIDVVERKMSSQNWQSIDYEAVPSKANVLYNSAFLRHDEERRRLFLGAVQKGEAKINSSVTFPHELAHKYYQNGRYLGSRPDQGIEAMWNALPDMVKDDSSTICVADGSGSMTCNVGGKGNHLMALTVANALAIYFAERCKGQFKDKYITFSHSPKLVDLSGANTLLGKLKIAGKHCEVADTNVEAVFDLLLDTALEFDMDQNELPNNVLILSDMEFNSCVVNNTKTKSRYSYSATYERGFSKTLFESIKEKWAKHGYTLPKLIFWNLNSRSGAMPVTQNDVACLVSGFSVNILKQVFSDRMNPYDMLVDSLLTERYDAVGKTVVKVLS